MAVAITLQTIVQAVASDLRLFQQATLQSVNQAGDVLTIDQSRELFPDRYVALDQFVRIPDGQWRYIAAFDPATGQVTVNRPFSPAPSAGAQIEFYAILNPDEWRSVVNSALTSLYRRERASIVLTPGVYEYALPAWIETKGQVEDVFLRDTTTGQEIPLRHTLKETGNAVTLEVSLIPLDSFEVVVVARRYYEELATDSSTTTCPFRLIRAVAAAEAAEAVAHTLGPATKGAWGYDLALVRQRAELAKQELMPTAYARSYTTGHTQPLGPRPLWSPDWS